MPELDHVPVRASRVRICEEISDDSGRGAGARAGIVKTFPVFRGFKGLVKFDRPGVAAAELVVRAVAADDDVSGFSMVQGWILVKNMS